MVRRMVEVPGGGSATWGTLATSDPLSSSLEITTLGNCDPAEKNIGRNVSDFDWHLSFITPQQQTSNVTGRHRATKQKLPADYRAPPLKRMSCCDAFSPSSVVSHTFSVLCMYSKFGHHPHPLGYLRAKFSFFCGLHC